MEIQKRSRRLKLEDISADDLARVQGSRVSDRRLAYLTESTEDEVREYRKNAWASFPFTNALIPAVLSLNRSRRICTRPTKTEDEAAPTDRRKIMILGSGPNRIGQGIEFDYCCCHAVVCAAARQDLKRSWSTAIRKPSRLITTLPIGSTSSRSRSKT